MFRKSLSVFLGNALASVLLLMRNLLLAHLLSVEDYGIAVTLAIVVSAVEMISALGLQQQLVQSKRGDEHKFQQALQFIQLLRGSVSAFLLFVSAEKIALLLGTEAHAWAYKVLCLVPLLYAIVHLDIHRATRNLKYKALLLSEIVPAFVSLLLVYPLFVLLQDWRVMLTIVILQGIVQVAVSHYLADRAWRLYANLEIISSSIRFGWPIMANGLLLFIVFQSDKVIVASHLGHEALAVFSMGVTLSLTPTLVIARTLQNIWLPGLSALADNDLFQSSANTFISLVAAITTMYVFGSFLLSGLLVSALLGEKYYDLSLLIFWFCASQSVRIIKEGLSVVSLSLGDARLAFISNFAKLLFVPLAVFIIHNGFGIFELIVLSIIAESIGLLISIWFLTWKRHRLSVTACVMISYSFGSGLLASLWAIAYPDALVRPSIIEVGISFFCVCAALVLFFLLNAKAAFVINRRR